METRTLYLEQDGRWLFWEVTWEATEVEFAEGTVGEEGDVINRSFTSSGEAHRFVEELLEKRLAQGYLEDGGPHHEAGRDKTVTRVSYGASNPELESLILETPDDPMPFLVYADWLQSRGDPLGELIVIQRALAQERTDILEKAEANLLTRHGEYFFGGLNDDRDLAKFDWELGFIRSAALFLSSLKKRELDGESVLRSFLSVPATRFMRALAVLKPSDDWDETSYDAYVRALVGSGPKPLLTSLRIGGAPGTGDVNVTEDLVSTFPRLRELSLLGGNIELSSAQLENLEVLIVSGVITARCLSTIATRRWPKLKTLAIDFSGYYLNDLSTLKPLLVSTTMPHLESLAIRNTMIGDELCLAVAHSRWARQLKSLELSSCRLSSAGVKTLADNVEAFDELRTINLGANNLSEADAAGLLPTVERVILDYVHPYEDFGAVKYDNDLDDYDDEDDDEYERRKYGDTSHLVDDDELGYGIYSERYEEDQAEETEEVPGVDEEWDDLKRDDPFDIDDQ